MKHAAIARGDAGRPDSPAAFRTTLLAILTLWVIAGVQRYAVSAFLGASSILTDFGITATAAGLLAAIYFPIYGAMQIPSGVLADSRSPKDILLWSSAMLVASSLVFAVAPTLELAVAARALVGFGSSFIWMASLKLFWTSGRQSYSRLIGALVVAGNLGAILGLLGLPVLLDRVSWRVATAVTVAPALALFAVILLRPAPPVRGATRQFWPAMALGARVCWALLRDARFWPIFLPSMMWNGVHFGLLTWLPRYARDVLGQEPARVGALAALIPFGLVLSGYVSGSLYPRFGRRGVWLFYGSAALYTAGLACLPLVGALAGWPGFLYLIVLALGLLFGSYFTSMALLAEFVPEERLGAATGLLNGGSFGPAFVTPWLFGLVLDLVDHPTGGSWTYSAAAFGAMLAVPPLLMALALLGSWWLYRGPRRIATRQGHG